jgi:glycosyltransferase involved in cell wall biosynthesis
MTNGLSLTISVLIPTYNRQVRLMQAIDCVLAQTVPVHEILVIDDGSTDGTAEAVRIRYGSQVKLVTQKNQGVSAARNLGIREAQGEWIAFLDSDDSWQPTKIERQIQALDFAGPGYGFCFTDNLFGGDPNMKFSKFEESRFATIAKFGTLEAPSSVILAGKEPFFTSGVLIQTSLLREINGFDETLVIGEDTDLFFRLSFKTKFCYVAEPLACIDRTPSRTDGLCNLYFTRDDRKYETLQRRFAKWLKMPEVIGTAYAGPARESLRELCYDSFECKMHEFRVSAALREVSQLRALGDSYPSVLMTLVSRKLRKLQRQRVTS